MGFDEISGYMVNFVQQGEDTVVANLVIDKRSLPLHLQKMIVPQLLQVVAVWQTADWAAVLLLKSLVK